MSKKENLAKSQKEKELSEEYKRYVGLKGANFSMSVLVFLWIVLSLLPSLDEAAKSSMGLLVTVTCFSNFAYQFVKNRRKTVAFFLVLFLIAAIMYLVLFLRVVLELF